MYLAAPDGAILMGMQKVKLSKPVLFTYYGLPGSGKTFFSRQVAELFGIPHISSDRVRSELFDNPSFSRDEQAVVSNIMNMMVEEYFKVGMSVIYDVSLNRLQDRRIMRDIARSGGATPLLVWLQAEPETCFARARGRDGRKADDRYSTEMTKELFTAIMNTMQPPQGEDPLVISAKHLFNSQRETLMRKLKELGLLAPTDNTTPTFAKPALINLVNRAQVEAGRTDHSRRNLTIR